MSMMLWIFWEKKHCLAFMARSGIPSCSIPFSHHLDTTTWSQSGTWRTRLFFVVVVGVSFQILVDLELILNTTHFSHHLSLNSASVFLPTSVHYHFLGATPTTTKRTPSFKVSTTFHLHSYINTFTLLLLKTNNVICTLTRSGAPNVKTTTQQPT